MKILAQQRASQKLTMVSSWPLVLILFISILTNIHSFGISSNAPSNSTTVLPDSMSPDEVRSDLNTSTSTLAPLPTTLSWEQQREIRKRFYESLRGGPDETYNIFNDLQNPNAPLIQKIIAVEKFVCDNVCGSDYHNASHRLHKYHVCESCQCEPNCALYDNCCPDIFLLRNVTYQNEAECVILSPTNVVLYGKYGRDFNRGIYSSLIAKCPTNEFNPNNTSELTQRRKCEQPDVSKQDEALPVSDISTNLPYKNVYCASCHNVRPGDIHEWFRAVSCNKPSKLLTSIPSKEELYNKLISEAIVQSTECQMTYYSDAQNKYRRPCQQPMKPLISDCSPRYRSSAIYNEEVEKACHMYTSQYQFSYKNIFCYLCHTAEKVTLTNLLVYNIDTEFQQSVNLARLSFSSLIAFKVEHGFDAYAQKINDVLAIECSPTQFYDNATCSCRDIQCAEWRTFDPETNTCPGGLGHLGVGFQACLRVYIDFDTPPASSTVKSLSQEFESLEPTHKMIVTISDWCPRDKRIVIHIESSAIEDDVEDTSYAHEYYENTFNKDGDLFCIFLKDELDRKSDVYGNTSLESCAFEMVDTTECPAFTDFSNPCIRSDLGPVKQIDAINITTFQTKNIMQSSGAPPFIYFTEKDFAFFPYRRTDHCSFVNIPTFEFKEKLSVLRHRLSLRDIGKVSVGFQRNNTNITVCFSDYLQWIKSDISQCAKHLFNKHFSDISFDTWTIAGLISIITSCISLFFLLLTFLTYVIFDELRTKGCVNLMVLTVVLFIAQALYEFGMEQYENQILCSIFGVMIHYFWLASIFSMNACTIERFIKLYFPLESRSFFLTDKPLVIATLYTFLCPFLIISCNIVANLVLTNEFGYGSPQICYINASYSRIFSFVMPMCVILVVNVVLLIVTITKLRKQTLPGDRKKMSSGSRIGLVACVRLSVVTGGTWLISLLYEAIPVEALGYVFTALLGFQGVVFFFSLLGNARILGLYRGLVKSKLDTTSTNGSTSAKSS